MASEPKPSNKGLTDGPTGLSRKDVIATIEGLIAEIEGRIRPLEDQVRALRVLLDHERDTVFLESRRQQRALARQAIADGGETEAPSPG